MTVRTRTSSAVFHHAFELKGIDRRLPAGTYPVEIDEELIDGLSFSAYRRIQTVITVPGMAAASTETLAIDPADLEAALDLDRKPPSSSRQP